jgi:hypothetical protein
MLNPSRYNVDVLAVTDYCHFYISCGNFLGVQILQFVKRANTNVPMVLKVA